jgi:hypothetical protein
MTVATEPSKTPGSRVVEDLFGRSFEDWGLVRHRRRHDPSQGRGRVRVDLPSLEEEHFETTFKDSALA